MEILRNLGQIYDKINNLFDFKDKNFIVENNFIQEIAPYDTILNLKQEIQSENITQKDIDDLFSLIFQLNEYTALVCNLTHFFLVAKKYDVLYLLVSKIFVAHIGNRYYRSSFSTEFFERNFDRFIEIVKTANIKNESYIPFLLEVYKCNNSKNYCKWKRPALEYLQNFFVDNERWLIDFVSNNPSLRYKTYGAILDFNTTRGVEYLIKDFMQENSDKEQCTSLLKNYKRDVLFYIDTEMPKVDNAKKSQLLQVMLSMDEDNEVMARIQDFYANVKDENIKATISNRLGISETLNIRTEKQFLYSARRKIKEPQERALGLPFDKVFLKLKSGEMASNTVYTFLIYLFKEDKNLNNLPKLNVLKNIFEIETLENFAYKMFLTLTSKPDILQAKWCVRLFVLFCSNKNLPSIFEFLTILINQNRTKEAKYLILCLIYAQKFEIIEYLQQNLENNVLLIKENLGEFVLACSKSFDMHEDDINDLLVSNQFSMGEFDIQRDRLFKAFICGKMYPKVVFQKLFIENAIYNKLAQNLVFGEYRFNRLYNAFIIKNREIEFIVGRTIFEDNAEKDADILLGIIHPLECDFKFEKIFNFYPSPTFEQFKHAKFDARDYNLSTTTVNRFVGVVINTQPFLNYLFKNGFVPNKSDEEVEYKVVVYKMPTLNLFCEVEFEKSINEKSAFNSLSYISFYKLSDTLKAQNKFIPQKSNAITIQSIPYRFFNYILSLIYDASKL